MAAGRSRPREAGKVIVRDFSFTLRATVAVPAAPTKPGKGLKILVSVAATQAKGVGTSTLNRAGAPGSSVLIKGHRHYEDGTKHRGLQRDLQMRRHQNLLGLLCRCVLGSLEGPMEFPVGRQVQLETVCEVGLVQVDGSYPC